MLLRWRSFCVFTLANNLFMSGEVFVDAACPFSFRNCGEPFSINNLTTLYYLLTYLEMAEGLY